MTTYRIPYISKEGAAKVAGSEYTTSWTFALYEADDDCDPDQAYELAERYFAKFPPADLDFWVK